MKKYKILALVLALVFIAAAIVGCGEKVKLEDVEADPAGYLAEAMKLTLKNTPFASLLDEEKKIAFELA